jgi:heptosyltransferase-2
VKREYTGNSTTCRRSRRGILVLAPNWLGDAVMATPFLYVLRRTFPDREIYLLCRSYTAALFRLSPAVDGLVEYERRNGIVGALHAMKRGVPAAGRETCFVLPRSFSSALVSFLGGARRRVGYSGECRTLLLTDVLPSGAYRSGHLTAAYVRLVELVTGRKESALPLPVVIPPYEWQVSLAAMGIPQDYVVISPGAEYGDAKMWLTNRYAALASDISQKTGREVVVIGSVRERSIAEEIVSGTGVSGRNLAGELTVEALLCVLRGASLVIGNDSGPVHISAAMGRPTLAIFGSTSPVWTSPRGRSVHIVRTNVECSPCFERSCPHGEPRCMSDIDEMHVFEVACRMMGEDCCEEATRNH